jgi:hypothetical protein
LEDPRAAALLENFPLRLLGTALARVTLSPPLSDSDSEEVLFLSRSIISSMEYFSGSLSADGMIGRCWNVNGLRLVSLTCFDRRGL